MVEKWSGVTRRLGAISAEFFFFVGLYELAQSEWAFRYGTFLYIQYSGESCVFWLGFRFCATLESYHRLTMVGLR